MFEAMTIRTNEVDGDWELKYFEAAFAPKSQALMRIGAGSQAPATKKYIRSSALPTQLAEELEQTYADILGDGAFVYATIHQDLANLRRRLRNTKLPAPRLGKRLADLIDSGCPLELAYEDILKDFFACLERELGCYVRSVRVYENDGKPYKDGAKLTHVHMCIPLPAGRSYYRFTSEFSRLYDSLIYPVQMPIVVTGRLVTAGKTLEDLKREPREIQDSQNLNFKPGRVDDEVSHPTYSVKQIVNEAVLRYRLHSSSAAKTMKGGKFQ